MAPDHHGRAERRIVGDQADDGRRLRAVSPGEVVAPGVVERSGGDLVPAGGAPQAQLFGPARGSLPEDVEHLVDGVLRHLPPRRQLAAGDGDQSARRAGHAVTPGQVGRLGVAGRPQQRPQPGPRPDHVLRHDVDGGRVVERVEQQADVGGGAVRAVEIAVVVRVGRADVRVLPPRHGEHRRPRPGTDMITAQSLLRIDRGTTMWTPRAGRMSTVVSPSSESTSSIHTPAALTTARARTSIVRPSPVSTVAPTMAPASSLRSATTGAWLTTTAPWSSAAVRAIVSTSRASSTWAS